MTDSNAFTKLVPGFDFLQTLVKNAGAALPSIGQWVAPTLNPDEIEKRIDELRTVQFWLEQNARMLATTIQALEVQRMTLSTLKTMNVQMEDLRDSLQVRMPTAEPRDEPEADLPEPEAAPVAEAKPEPKPAARKSKAAAAPAPAEVTPAVDPMQWWGALTKQFTQIATAAMKDTATDAAKNLAGAAVKQGVDAAGQTLKKAAAVPAKVVRKTVRAAAPRKRAAAPQR